MSLPIRWRIAIPYVLLILVSMLALGAFISGFIRQTYMADLESKLADQARMIGDIISPELKSAGEAPNLDTQAKHWADLLGTRVTIIAPDGTVWGESDEDRTRMANHSDRPEVINALRDGTGAVDSARHWVIPCCTPRCVSQRTWMSWGL
jgi:two-component system phosphate regulon sensor histidine kinase PhoR